MTDHLPPPEDARLADGVLQLMPQLQAARRQALRLVIAGGTAGFVASAGLMWLDAYWGILTWFGTIGGMLFGRQIARESAERRAMPEIAAVVGLTHRKGAFKLPEVLLPSGVTRVDDVLAGSIAGRSIEFAEILVTTSGKPKRSLFRGVVIAVEMAMPLPRFLLAAPDDTQLNAMGRTRLPTRDLRPEREVERHRLWLAPDMDDEPAPLARLLDRLGEVAKATPRNMQLRSATSSGQILMLAFDHPHELFHIGDPFSPATQLEADVTRALREVMVPLRMGGRVLELEAEAMAPPLPRHPARP